MKKYKIIYPFVLISNICFCQHNIQDSMQKSIQLESYYLNHFAYDTSVNTSYQTNEDKYSIANSTLNSLLIIPQPKKKYPLYVSLATQSAITSNKTVPFWMRANQFGSIPLDGGSFSLIGNIEKSYDTSRNTKIVDWGAGIEGRLNLGGKVDGVLIAAYVKARLSIIELRIGRWKETMGLVDPSLSSGAFTISGNALGIPKAQLGIVDYWNIPLTKQIISIKGNFAFGSFGATPIVFGRSNVKVVDSYYHQKSFYVRIGKPNWKVKFYGGANHQVMFGNESKIYGPKFKLSTFETFKYAVIGKAYGARGVESSKVGNHIGSIDQGLEINLKNIDLMGYHQFFYEVGGLYYLNNIKDGVWGISIKNKKDSKEKIWNKIVFEFVYSKSQGGEFDAPITPSGDENYYNNYIYGQGWTYKGQNLGNPLLTSKEYARKNLPMRKNEAIANNRIAAYHTAVEGRLLDFWDYIIKLTYSSNSGTYATSPMGTTTGGSRRIYPAPYFPTVGQFSGYLEVERPIFKSGYHLGAVLAVDQGKLLYNSVGGMIKFTKRW